MALRYMLEFDLKTKSHGIVTFARAAHGSVVVGLDLKRGNGLLRYRICAAGTLVGPTITCSAADFERTCRNWWRAYRKRQVQNELTARIHH